MNEEIEKIVKREGNHRGEIAVSRKEMERLLKFNKGKIIFLNEEVGNCYCHLAKYQDREYFCVTGEKLVYIDRHDGIGRLNSLPKN